MAASLTVKSVLRSIIALDKKKSSKEGAEAMVKSNIGSIIVSESGKYVGIVTERDLVKKVIAVGKDPTKTTLGDVMSNPLIAIEASRGLGPS